MRALFGVVSLLVVLAIVLFVAKKQLQAVAPSIAPAAATPSAGNSAATPTVQEQVRGVQQKVLQDVGRALEQGAQRASDAQP
jgi:HAMP domain-containing protein